MLRTSNSDGGLSIFSGDGDLIASIGDDGYVTVGRAGHLRVGTSTVPAGTQAAHIADPSSGGTVDAQARTAIGAILDALEAFGMVAAA